MDRHPANPPSPAAQAIEAERNTLAKGLAFLSTWIWQQNDVRASDILHRLMSECPSLSLAMKAPPPAGTAPSAASERDNLAEGIAQLGIFMHMSADERADRACDIYAQLERDCPTLKNFARAIASFYASPRPSFGTGATTPPKRPHP